MVKMSITQTTKRLVVVSGLAALTGLLLVTWLQIKPLGMLFLLITLFWLYQIRFGVEIVPPEDLLIKVNAFFQHIKTTREANRKLFSAVASTLLGSLAIVGHILSGSSVALIGLIISVLLSTKYNFKIVKLKETCFNWPDKVYENDIDDFLPEVNEANMSLLERASDQSNVTFISEDVEEKSEEIPSDLLIPDSIPEVDENSTDEDDALGIDVPDNVRERSTTPSETELKKGHFKKDSFLSTPSSSEEALNSLNLVSFHKNWIQKSSAANINLLSRTVVFGDNAQA